MVPPKDTQDPDNAPDGHREHWSGVFHGLLKWRKTGKSEKQAECYNSYTPYPAGKSHLSGILRESAPLQRIHSLLN